MFDQMTFEMRRSDSPLAEAIRFTNSSGADVPKASIVSQITIGGIPNVLAILLLPLTSICPHQISEMSPSMINTAAMIIPRFPSKLGSVTLMTHPAKIVIIRTSKGMEHTKYSKGNTQYSIRYP